MLILILVALCLRFVVMAVHLNGLPVCSDADHTCVQVFLAGCKGGYTSEHILRYLIVQFII